VYGSDTDGEVLFSLEKLRELAKQQAKQQQQQGQDGNVDGDGQAADATTASLLPRLQKLPRPILKRPKERDLAVYQAVTILCATYENDMSRIQGKNQDFLTINMVIDPSEEPKQLTTTDVKCQPA
jgi:hypothetical protein